MRLCDQESQDLEELTLFLTDSVTAGTEGLIVKSLDSTYEPSRCFDYLGFEFDFLLPTVELPRVEL